MSYNPFFPAAGPPPAGHAFSVLPPSGYGPAKRMSNAATHKFVLGPGSASRANLSGMAQAANTYAGLPPGTARARQGAKGNIYIEATHGAIEGWGGEPPVTTHFSGHVPRPPAGTSFGTAAARPSAGAPAAAGAPAPAPAPAVGAYHAKTVGAEGERYVATSIPRGGPAPVFTNLATPAKTINKAYPAASTGNRSATVAAGLAAAFSNYARLNPAPGAAPLRRGGRKSRKHTKKTRKSKARKMKSRKH